MEETLADIREAIECHLHAPAASVPDKARLVEVEV